LRPVPVRNRAGKEQICSAKPQLPCEIREGQFISSYWPQAELDFSNIDYWAAWDSHDRVYKLIEASRFEHWKSVTQQKKAFRNNKAESR
jgi:hypothetical protein